MLRAFRFVKGTPLARIQGYTPSRTLLIARCWPAYRGSNPAQVPAGRRFWSESVKAASLEPRSGGGPTPDLTRPGERVRRSVRITGYFTNTIPHPGTPDATIFE